MVDLAITAAQVQPGSGGTFENLNAGAAVTAGQTVYKSVNNTWLLADADASTTTATVVGIAVNDASVGQPVKVQTGGDVTLGAAAAPAIGKVYVLSDTPGGIKPVEDTTTGDFMSVLGVGLTGNVLRLGILVSGGQVP